MMTNKTIRLLTKENKTKSYFSWLVFNIVNRRSNREIPSVKTFVKSNFPTTHNLACRLGRLVVCFCVFARHVLKVCRREEDEWESRSMLRKRTLNIWQTL